MKRDLCTFGWFDGKSGHICRAEGRHDGHVCAYCRAVHDPDLRLSPAQNGGFVAERGTQRGGQQFMAGKV
ncbi:hypothetical protein [Kribbella sp. NBC_00889]|uniref:hypothetical protein n=1 Tax=Kribbella sp. NBC_00889 TaxID=2975974 RepID=UPI003868B3E0|nr:hypothetical protein OG817_01855 [Kribbella sp. NBC_00889]